MENTLTTTLPDGTKIDTQCARLGHCKEHKECCYCAEEKRVMAEILAQWKAA